MASRFSPTMGKDAFYRMIANSRGMSADYFANNPFGVSFQEIQSMLHPRTNLPKGVTGSRQPTQPVYTNYSAPSGGTGGGFEPIMFEGKMYNDADSYRNAVIASANEEYRRTEKMLKEAFDNGILKFSKDPDDPNSYYNILETNRKRLAKQLTENLNQNSAYFTALSPNATQSAQFDRQAELQENEAEQQKLVNAQEKEVEGQEQLYRSDFANKNYLNEQNRQSNIDNITNRINSITSGNDSLNAISPTLDTYGNTAMTKTAQQGQFKRYGSNAGGTGTGGPVSGPWDFLNRTIATAQKYI